MLEQNKLNDSLKYGFPILFGVFFAACLYPLWNLQGRWFYVTVVGLFLVFISMIFIYRFSDFLFIFFMFAIPLAGFTKWLFIRHYPEPIFHAAPLSGAIGIGLMDFLIFGLYLSWFSKIFITKEEPLPRFQRFDWLVVSLIGIYVMSLWGTLDLKLGIYAIVHLIKHILVYFYVSRNFKRSHISWFIAAVFFAIFVESTIGMFQYHTDMFKGLILDKGAGSERLNWQGRVPGIEGVARATGTSYDSHSLGLYLAMLLPYPFVFLLYSNYVRWSKRIISGSFFILGTVVLIATYSRSGWLSTAIALCMSILVFLGWREKRSISSIVLLFLVMLILAPWAGARIYERFSTAPPEIMTARFDQFNAALNMWKDNPFFGFGIGNYMKLNFGQETTPVHNVFLWIAADTGLFGVLAFYGIIIAALRRLWIIIRQHHYPDCRIALAVATGLVAYLLDGLTNPLFREPIVYIMFWFLIAMSVALTRLHSETRNGPEAHTQRLNPEK